MKNFKRSFWHLKTYIYLEWFGRNVTCRKYGLNVIIDLHAAPGSQNGMEHSATRDGSLEWGLTDESIQQTVAVIDFLAARQTPT